VNQDVRELAAEYARALQGYLAGHGEAALQQAYELGRQTLAKGLGLLDVATVQHWGLLRALAKSRTPQERSRALRAGQKLCVESLLPFEMAHRRVQEVNTALRDSEHRYRNLVDTARDVIYTLSTDGRLSTQHGPPRTLTPAEELLRAQFHFLWPNLGINIFPGRPNFSIGPFVPVTPDRTYRFLDYFFGPDVEPAWIDELLVFDQQVGREDLGLVEGVQRGVASGAVQHGVLMSHSEQLIAHFQALTAAALAR